MKKLILVLLLILPFSTFASSLDEVQNLKIEIKWKSINWLSLYNSIEKTIEKKTKWDNNKKLALYKKLLSQTEKSNNDIYKKLSIILKYWKNKLENSWNIKNSNWVINQNNDTMNTQWNSIQNAINSNKNSSTSDWTAYYWNDWVVSWQWNFSDKEIKEADQRAFEAQTEYEKQRWSATFIWFTTPYLFNKINITETLSKQKVRINTDYRSADYWLITQEAIWNYNLYLSIFKDWWLVNNYSKLNWKWDIWDWFINLWDLINNDNSEDIKFLRSLWYKWVNWKIVYDESLNTFKNELKVFEYLK